jgi:NADH-quinone oxidoreductase subunit M
MWEAIPYNQQIGIPILSYLIFIPTLGALVIMGINRKRTGLIRGFTFTICLINFALSLLLLTNFKLHTPSMQFVERVEWIRSIGVSYKLGIDGISLWLVLLTTFLGAISVLSTWKAVTERVKAFSACMLMLESGILGVFTALDIFLFYLFWEIMLVPMYFLIGIWGGPRRLYATIKFFLYTLFGGLVLIIGFLGVYFNYHQYALAHNLSPAFTFDLLQLYRVPIPQGKQFWIFLALFVGFAIKVPMVPFHTWLPDAHVEAPTAASVILAGLLLKMGTYGFVRFSLPLLPLASQYFVPFVAVLAIIGILYGGIVAIAQVDIKKVVAYSSVSHLGFIMLGLFALNREGIQGGLLQMVNHGLCTGALFLLVGLIYERRHTRLIDEFGGLSKQLPAFTLIYTIVTLASIGFPGLNSFVGELFILVGSYKVNVLYSTLAAVGVLVGAFYMLWLYQRVILGRITKSENARLLDLSFREKATLVPIVVFIFWIGLYPTPFLRISRPSVENLLRIMQAQAASSRVLARNSVAEPIGLKAEAPYILTR